MMDRRGSGWTVRDIDVKGCLFVRARVFVRSFLMSVDFGDVVTVLRAHMLKIGRYRED